MDTVTVSPKFQVVIPKAVRERHKLVPGQQIMVISYGNRMEFIPVRPASELRGIARGIDTSGYREETDRL